LLRLHAMEHGVARDAGIVDQHLNRTERGLYLLQAVDAGVVGGDVPFEDRDAGLGLELLRRLVVAAVVGGHLVSRRLEPLRDRLPDPTRTARHHRNASHDRSSLETRTTHADDSRRTEPPRAHCPITIA